LDQDEEEEKGLIYMNPMWVRGNLRKSCVDSTVLATNLINENKSFYHS